MSVSLKIAEIAKSIKLAFCSETTEPIPLKSAIEMIAKNGEESQKAGISISLILTSLRNLLGYLKDLSQVFKSASVDETSPLIAPPTKFEANLDNAIECLAQQQKNVLDPNFPLSRDLGPYIREVKRCAKRSGTTPRVIEVKLRAALEKMGISDAAINLLKEIKN